MPAPRLREGLGHMREIFYWRGGGEGRDMRFRMHDIGGIFPPSFIVLG